MDVLLQNVMQLIWAAWDVVTALFSLVLPWTPLAAWIGFWLFAVNWQRLRHILLSGGCVGLILLGIAMVLVWGAIAPPPDGVHHLLGLQVSNFVGKTVYVTALFSIMLLCGAVQLSGSCNVCFDDETGEESAETSAHAH